jgi:hypothetical protein
VAASLAASTVLASKLVSAIGLEVVFKLKKNQSLDDYLGQAWDKSGRLFEFKSPKQFFLSLVSNLATAR